MYTMAIYNDEAETELSATFWPFRSTGLLIFNLASSWSDIALVLKLEGMIVPAMPAIAVNAFNTPREYLGRSAYSKTFYEVITFSLKTESNALFNNYPPSELRYYEIIEVVILFIYKSLLRYLYHKCIHKFGTVYIGFIIITIIR